MISLTGEHRWSPPLLKASQAWALHKKLPTLMLTRNWTPTHYPVCASLPDLFVQEEDICNASGKPQARNVTRIWSGPGGSSFGLTGVAHVRPD